MPLFNAAQGNALSGFQGALDIFGQSVPQQLEAFQGGNVAAQNALLAGLPQQQAAILGQQLNPNALQPTILGGFDPSMFQTQLPEFTTINDALGLNPPEQQPIMGEGNGNFLNRGQFNPLSGFGGRNNFMQPQRRGF